MIKVGINGFGRIGRSFLRSYLSDKNARSAMQVVCINIGPSRIEQVAHMFKFDTFMGAFSGEVSMENDNLVVDGLKIPVVAQLQPLEIGWNAYDVDWVVEATGKFTTKEKAQLHIDAGAKKVLITAEGKGADATVVPGVNDDIYNPEIDHVVSLASCTTNALAPMIKVLHENFGIKSAFMNTIHSYTNAQVLMDVEVPKDIRRGRAAAMNIIPTTTGAANLIGVVYPELNGCISGISTRVPVGKVSIVDLAFTAQQELDRQAIIAAFQKAKSEGSLVGILDSTDAPLVSSDYINNPYSVVIDELLTDVCGHTGKLFGWYDNEYGYAHRLKDFLIKHG